MYHIALLDDDQETVECLYWSTRAEDRGGDEGEVEVQAWRGAAAAAQ